MRVLLMLEHLVDTHIEMKAHVQQVSVWFYKACIPPTIITAYNDNEEHSEVNNPGNMEGPETPKKLNKSNSTPIVLPWKLFYGKHLKTFPAL